MIFTFQCPSARILTDHFADKIFQMESLKQILILPQIKKQKINKKSKNEGRWGRMEATVYLQSRGNSKKEK